MHTPRKRNPRRVMLDHSRTIKRRAEHLISWWTCASTVFEPETRGERDGAALRPRREDEYPENRIDYWASTCVKLDELAAEIAKARDFAYARYAELKPRDDN